MGMLLKCPANPDLDSSILSTTRNLCDRKEVTLGDQAGAIAKFYIFPILTLIDLRLNSPATMPEAWIRQCNAFSLSCAP